jgi:ferrous iron transport protein A
MEAKQIMRLSQLLPGMKGKVKSFSNSNKQLHRRLLDMGILEGESMRITERLPFNGPIVMEANNQVLSIRFNDSNNIEIEVNKCGGSICTCRKS